MFLDLSCTFWIYEDFTALKYTLEIIYALLYLVLLLGVLTDLSLDPVLHHLGYGFHDLAVLGFLYQSYQDGADEAFPHVGTHHSHAVLHQVQAQYQQLTGHWGNKHRVNGVINDDRLWISSSLATGGGRGC